METFSFNYDKVAMSDLPPADQELCRKAAEATAGSYAPYSSYRVGAAIKLSSGEIITGANQENASYPCGTCAERTALNYAQTAFPHTIIETIAIAATQNDKPASTPPYPCGLCRQSLAETEHRQGKPIRVLLPSGNEATIIYSVACLLPFTFQHSNLNL